MNNAEIYSVLRTQISDLKEIPYPELPAGAPAHEGKPYRDPHLYVSCPKEKWLELAKILKNDDRLSFDFLTMVTAVDYVKPEPRMDVVYHLYSMRHKHRAVVKVSVRREGASVDSVVSLWATADWQEREVYDMYGIKFEGHPNCARILMWDGFPGWPLRKDFQHIPDRYDD